MWHNRPQLPCPKVTFGPPEFWHPNWLPTEETKAILKGDAEESAKMDRRKSLSPIAK